METRSASSLTTMSGNRRHVIPSWSHTSGIFGFASFSFAFVSDDVLRRFIADVEALNRHANALRVFVKLRA